MHPTDRDDLSRFLVHLTRNSGGASAEENLRTMLEQGVIEARNAHCLFHRKFDQLGFSDKLKKKFRTVCLTEVPFSQLRHLAAEIRGRRIKLKPYGLVFLKSQLLERGASPALYINAKGTTLRDYLLAQFDAHFKNRSLYRKLQAKYGDEADSIIRYYSLINVISATHDFSWEREWRHSGDLAFELYQLFAIVADDPENFRKSCKKAFPSGLYNQVRRIPILSPQWNAERIIEELSMALWSARAPQKLAART